MENREPRKDRPKGDAKKAFCKPKLTYKKPTLTKLGDVTKVTAGFFGGFYP